MSLSEGDLKQNGNFVLFYDSKECYSNLDINCNFESTIAKKKKKETFICESVK